MKLFFFIWIAWLASEILLSRIMRSGNSGKSHDKSSLKILWITISLSVTAGVFLAKTGPAIINENYIVIYYSGLVLIVSGLLIRWMAILKLRKSFTVDVAIAVNQRIEDSGIYKHIRHPSYLGSLMSFAGLSIIFNHWISLIIIFIPVLSAFLYRINIEEKVMCTVFKDEYANYIKKSWKLLPYIF